LRLRCHSCIRRSMPRSLAVLRWSKGWSPEANREIDEHARLLLLSCLIMGIAAPGCSRAIKYREGSGTALGGVRTYKRIPYGGHPRPHQEQIAGDFDSLQQIERRTISKVSVRLPGPVPARTRKYASRQTTTAGNDGPSTITPSPHLRALGRRRCRRWCRSASRKRTRSSPGVLRSSGTAVL
jgi:hypothetical protein